MYFKTVYASVLFVGLFAAEVNAYTCYYGLSTSWYTTTSCSLGCALDIYRYSDGTTVYSKGCVSSSYSYTGCGTPYYASYNTGRISSYSGTRQRCYCRSSSCNLYTSSSASVYSTYTSYYTCYSGSSTSLCSYGCALYIYKSSSLSLLSTYVKGCASSSYSYTGCPTTYSYGPYYVSGSYKNYRKVCTCRSNKCNSPTSTADYHKYRSSNSCYYCTPTTYLDSLCNGRTAGSLTTCSYGSCMKQERTYTATSTVNGQTTKTSYISMVKGCASSYQLTSCTSTSSTVNSSPLVTKNCYCTSSYCNKSGRVTPQYTLLCVLFIMGMLSWM